MSNASKLTILIASPLEEEHVERIRPASRAGRKPEKLIDDARPL